MLRLALGWLCWVAAARLLPRWAFGTAAASVEVAAGVGPPLGCLPQRGLPRLTGPAPGSAEEVAAAGLLLAKCAVWAAAGSTVAATIRLLRSCVVCGAAGSGVGAAPRLLPCRIIGAAVGSADVAPARLLPAGVRRVCCGLLYCPQAAAGLHHVNLTEAAAVTLLRRCTIGTKAGSSPSGCGWLYCPQAAAAGGGVVRRVGAPCPPAALRLALT